MRPLIEYKDTFAVLDDLRKEGLFEQRVDILAQYDRAKRVEHVRARVVAFLEKERQTSRTSLFKRLNLKRTGLDIAAEALNNLFVSGTVYVTQGPINIQGGRRGSLLVWAGAQSEEVPVIDCPVVRCAILGPHTHEIEEPVEVESETEEAVPEEFGLRLLPEDIIEPSTFPGIVLEEVQSNPSSQVKVPQPKTMKSVLVSALTAGK